MQLIKTINCTDYAKGTIWVELVAIFRKIADAGDRDPQLRVEN